MPLKYATNCLRCGGTNWYPWKHWHVCADCEPGRVAQLQADAEPKLKIELADKGIPRRNP